MRITYRGLSKALTKLFGYKIPVVVQKEDNNVKKSMRTGYKGVAKASRTDKFEAYLTVPKGGRTTKFHIGTFPTVSAAHIARLKYIDSLK